MNAFKTRNANPKLAVRQARNGLGVFALDDFPTGAVITRIKGRQMHWRELLKLPTKTLNNAYRYGPETYLVPEDGIGEYINHSCNPTAGIIKSNGLHLLALKVIKKEDEITFDYSTLIGEDDIWKMKCRCGEPGCRGIVRSFSSIPPDDLDRYLRLGIIPRYIQDTADKRL